MEYSKIITLSKKGFHIDQNLMIPIGFKPGYRLWGRYDGNDCESHDCNLIISSLPHASWKSLFRIRARVELKAPFEKIVEQIFQCCVNGVNENLEGELENHVNILSINSSVNTNHFVINFIIESPSLKLKNNISNGEYFSETGSSEKMLESCKVSIANKINENSYLQSIKAEFYGTKQYKVEWVKTLFHARRNDSSYEKAEEDMFRFIYNQKDMILQPEVRSDIQKLLVPNKKNKYISSYIAIFDSFNKTIILRKVKNNDRRLYKISFDYKLTSPHNKLDISDFSTGLNKSSLNSPSEVKNFTSTLLKSLDDDSKEIFIMRKKISRPSNHEEFGRISLHIETDKKPKKSNILHNIQNKIGKNKDGVDFLNKDDVGLVVEKITNHSVFISLRESFKKKREKFIREKLNEYGFSCKMAYSSDNKNSVTSNVLNVMAEADACIQICSIDDIASDELKKNRIVTKDILSVDWLLFEWGVARASNHFKSVMRMVDTTHVSKEEWEKHLRIDRDNNLIEFQTHTPDQDPHEDHFNNMFEAAVIEVAKRIK